MSIFHKNLKLKGLILISCVFSLIFFCSCKTEEATLVDQSVTYSDSKKEVNVFCCADDNNAMPTCVMIASLLCNIPKNQRLTVHVVYFDNSPMNEENVSKIKSLNHIRDFNLNFVSFDHKRIEEFNNEYWNKAILVKLFAAEIFTNIDEIIWIDDDVCVVGNIAEVYDLDMNKKYLAAVDLSSYYKKYLNGECDYWITAGFGFYNLKEMRKNNMTTKFIECCKNYTKKNKEIRSKEKVMGGIEEYVLTVAIPKKKVFLLDYQYCTIIPFANSNYNKKGSYFSDIKDSMKDSKIFHYTGIFKPWRLDDIAKIHPLFYTIWMDFYRMTPYFDPAKKWVI